MKSAGGHSATVVWERGVFKGSPVGGQGCCVKHHQGAVE